MIGVPYAEVIGDPIAHSKSPLIHKFWLGELGIEGDYRAVRVPADDLPAYLDSRRADPDWRGCNVTMPLKQAVRLLMDQCDDYELGAINCVLPRQGLLIGRNTDDAGVDEAFPEGVETGFPICLIGAGGAARAAIASLDVAAAYQFNLIVRNPEKDRKLIKCYAGDAFTFDQAEIALEGAAGLINATPLGMIGFPPMPGAVLEALSRMRSSAFVFDMVYQPIETTLLVAAESAGFETIDGLTMLIGQARHSFFHFFGQSVPRELDIQLRALLTQ